MPQYAAQIPEELATFEQLTSMSGLDFMRAVASGDIAGPPIAGHLNFRVDSVDEGEVVFRGTPEFAALNPMGTVHGGWYGTLLDSCMACAVMTMVPKGHVYTTLEYKVNIVRPIPVGMTVLARGRVQHAGRSTGIANGEITGAEDGRVYATGSTTCIIMKPGSA
ncbi:PaaI family thioesterase [Pseudoruegeria sp. HB172150]|uniref:PaaI family thioesterase n=1 Tax=Pseudoruegeria sp. HB172150 TaxID=2721164 RepID=UPI001555E3F9|nr:PaaI family thioesterase [Pseudoruegeria sp. HB172150]